MAGGRPRMIRPVLTQREAEILSALLGNVTRKNLKVLGVDDSVTAYTLLAQAHSKLDDALVKP